MSVVPAACAPLQGSVRPPRQPEQSGGASHKGGPLQVSTGRALGVSSGQSSRVVRQIPHELSVAEQQRQKEAEAAGCGAVAVPVSPLVDVLSVDDEASPDVSVVTQTADDVELAAKYFYSKHL